MDFRDGPVHAKPVVSEEMAVLLERQGWVRDRDFTVPPEGSSPASEA